MCTFNLLYILTDVLFFFSEHLMLNLSSITYDDNYFFFIQYSTRLRNTYVLLRLERMFGEEKLRNY